MPPSVTDPCDLHEEEIYKLKERYRVFIDESGDPFVHKDIRTYDDPSISPVMTITALIVAKTVYQEVFVPAVDEIKQEFWGSREVHFHSHEIRRKDGIFKVLLDPERYETFKQKMLGVFEKSSVTLISSSINKINFLKKAGKFKTETGNDYNLGDPYLINVNWILERLGHFIDGDTAKIIFEARGRKESRRIQGVLTETKKNGTFYHGTDRFKNISDEILFYTKKDNVNGVQMVDYCTYPFARHAKDASSPDNKLFDLLRRYIHKGDYGEYGLKEWP